MILNEIDLTDENLAIYFPFVPFISNKKKFLEFFPKIATLEIPEVWKFYCDLFAQKTNPHYEEVRKMIFQLTPDDMIKAIESVPSESVPEALGKMLNRVSEEQRVRTIDMVLPNISEERRIRAIDMILPHIPEERRTEVFNAFIRQIPEYKLKEWARKILDGDKQKSTA
jgi:hypothetical protein